ncbi:type II toxin-antitoxin system RelB/DinJ family antitoxin [Bartonella sp. AP19HLJMH]
MSDFIRIALTKVVHEKRLPFDKSISNAKTLKIFEKNAKG